MEPKFTVTNDHEVIKAWIEKHGGTPAMIDDPIAGSDRPGLRIDFPGRRDEILLSHERNSLKQISWHDFFSMIEGRELAFMYIDEEKLENPTWSYKFVNRDAPGVGSVNY